MKKDDGTGSLIIKAGQRMVKWFIFILLNITCILNVILIVKISRVRKSQVRKLILAVMILSFIWISGELLQVYAEIIFGRIYFSLLYYYSFGLYFLPSTSLIFVIKYVRYEPNKLNWKFTLLFVVPLLFYILLLTNNYHHLMFRIYVLDSKYILGPAMPFLIGYGIVMLAVMFGYLIYHIISNSNLLLFFKQVLIIFIGFLIPLLFGVLFCLQYYKILELPEYTAPTGMSFLLLIFYYGIIKHDLLKINPVSLKIVLNSVSDLFIVLDKNLNLIEYNKSFENKFSYLGISIRKSFINQIDNDEFNDALAVSIKEKNTQKLRLDLKNKNSDKPSIYIIEIIPIISDNLAMGLVVIFKDITELHEMQEKLILQERYVSLGMLIGGIAHNLRSPLMAISANVKILQDLAFEYKTAIPNNEVTTQDHQEIAAEMEDWLGKTNLSLEYISNALNSIRGQIINYQNEEKFKIYDVIERVNTIAKYELNNSKFVMNVNNCIENDLELNGSLNFLIQVINNLIMNAKQSYEQDYGIIEFSVYKQEQHVVFRVKDSGAGIPNDIQDKLFKEMVTTKGKNGAGLGLYISYSIIKSQFKGDIRFESEPGTGTAFYITIPL